MSLLSLGFETELRNSPSPIVFILCHLFRKIGLKTVFHYLQSYHLALIRSDIADKCQLTIEKYKNKNYSFESVNMDFQTYTIWLQGIDHMPDLVRKCINRLEQMSSYSLNVLTAEDILKMDIPKTIIDKYKIGHIRPAHFADIVRMYILAKYGGVWCDATLFFVEFPKDLNAKKFFTLRRVLSDVDGLNSSYIKVDGKLQSLWTTYFMSCSADAITPKFVYDMFCEYLSKTDKIIDYFWFDMIIRIGYDLIPEIKNEIDSNPINNNGSVFDLQPLLNTTYDQTLFDEMCCNSDLKLFKLTYKDFCPAKLPESFFNKMFNL